MKFTFSDPGDGGLRTIDHLPDGRLIRLQGRNGVGKTVSMRLLALCTGAENPWAGERKSWESLVAVLPDGFMIEAADPERTITWRLFPSRDGWPRDLLDDEADDELARVKRSVHVPWEPPVDVTINGKPEPDARPVLVRLLSGREGLLEVWTQQVRADERRFDRVTESAKSAINDLRDAFGHLQQSWHDANPELLAQARQRRSQLRESLDEHQDEVERIESQIRLAELSRQKAQKLQEAEERIPELDAELDSVTLELERFRQERDRLADELAKAAAGGDRTPKQREELDRALRNEQGRRDAHAAASRNLLRLLEREELEGVRRSDVPQEVSRARRRLRGIEAEIARIHKDEPVLDLAHRLRATLLDHQAPSDARLLASARLTATVEETDHALGERIASLEAAGPLHRLESERESLRDRVALLQKVLEAERTLRAKSRLVAEVAAAQEQQRERDRRIDDLAERQAETDAEVERFQERLVDLRDERRGLLGDAEGLEELRQAVQAARPQPSEVPTKEELADRRETAERLARELDDATEEVTRATDAAAAARHVLDDYGLGPGVPAGQEPLVGADETIAALQRHLDLARDAFSQLGDALTTQGPVDGVPPSKATALLAGRYASAWQAELSSNAFQEALFEGGELSSIDVLDGYFSWIDADGRNRRRPIQALSSGQMVYAYTKAIISDMSSPPLEQHRVIVLDEFAAYLDEHAQKQLVEDLREYVRLHERTQIVMVLPKDPGNDRGWVAEVVE